MLLLALILVLFQSTTPRVLEPRTLRAGEGWACDVVFPDRNTIVIADSDGRAQVSTDAGRSWSTHPARYVRELTIDSRGAIWGLYRWHGTHEPPSAALAVSKDTGTTWSTIELDPRVCLPETFITAPGEEPIIVAADGQLWRHAPGEAETFDRWSRLGGPNAKSGASGISIGELVYVGGRGGFSQDDGAHWKPATLEHFLVGFARAVDADGKPTSTLWSCTEDGALVQVEIGKQDWKLTASLVPRKNVPRKKRREPFAYAPRVFHIASGRDGIYMCGEDGVHALGARIEAGGKVVKLDGLQSNQAQRLRLSPDGRMWIVGHGVYRAEPGATHWERVWPK